MLRLDLFNKEKREMTYDEYVVCLECEIGLEEWELGDLGWPNVDACVAQKWVTKIGNKYVTTVRCLKLENI